ncbi:MAG: 3-deoxy-D-manno-octulosonate 8-phosphate phosphatase, YrbI family [Verrucomicrobia bacterium]|nr:3-deoxy-D-manno-octulosonate 8-phosphate phosphatase, YrbI family [Verrucomicrobiota bacterium]
MFDVRPVLLPPPMPTPKKHPVRIERREWSRVRLFAMDVDGVLTDGTIRICSDGSETKTFSILDGMGLKRLELAGIIVAWISGRPSGATSVRGGELKIPHIIQGRSDKLAALQELAAKLGLAPEQCAYVGDDDIDAAAIRWCGIGVSVPGAMPEALKAARYVTRRQAGHGAIREVCEHLLAAQVGSQSGAKLVRTNP